MFKPNRILPVTVSINPQAPVRGSLVIATIHFDGVDTVDHSVAIASSNLSSPQSVTLTAGDDEVSFQVSAGSGDTGSLSATLNDATVTTQFLVRADTFPAPPTARHPVEALALE